jgi:hypothetical protein
LLHSWSRRIYGLFPYLRSMQSSLTFYRMKWSRFRLYRIRVSPPRLVNHLQLKKVLSKFPYHWL